MFKEMIKKNWKFALMLFCGYLVITLVLGIITSLNSGQTWQDLLSASKHWLLWTIILIPGVLVLLVALIPLQIFIPMFIIVFGSFLLVSSLPEFEKLGSSIKSAVDIELFGAGTALAAVGLAFLQLYKKTSHTANEVKMIRDDLDKSERTVEELERNIQELKKRIINIRSNTDDMRENNK